MSEQTDRELLIEMKVLLEGNNKMTEKLYKVIFEGNGKPSIISRQDNIDEHIKNCPVNDLKTEVKDIKTQVNSITNRLAVWAGGGAVVFFGITILLKKMGLM